LRGNCSAARDDNRRSTCRWFDSAPGHDSTPVLHLKAKSRTVAARASGESIVSDWLEIGPTMRVFALRPYHPSAGRVYQPAASPERLLGRGKGSAGPAGCRAHHAGAVGGRRAREQPVVVRWLGPHSGQRDAPPAVRRAVTQGVVAVLDARTDLPVIGYGPGGTVFLREARPGVQRAD